MAAKHLGFLDEIVIKIKLLEATNTAVTVAVYSMSF